MPTPGEGVDTDDWDCPVDIEALEEYLCEEEWQCDVCETEYPIGSVFYGNRDADWDVCEACFLGDDAVSEEEEDVGAEEMAQRLQKLNMMEVERQKEHGLTPHQIQLLKPVETKAVIPHSKATFLRAMRVRAHFLVRGEKSEKVAFGTIESCNEDDTLTVLFDAGMTQTIRSHWAVKMTKDEEPHWKIVLGMELEEDEMPQSRLDDKTRKVRALGGRRMFNPDTREYCPGCGLECCRCGSEAVQKRYSKKGTETGEKLKARNQNFLGIREIEASRGWLGSDCDIGMGRHAQERRDKWQTYNIVKKEAQGRKRFRALEAKERREDQKKSSSIWAGIERVDHGGGRGEGWTNIRNLRQMTNNMVGPPADLMEK